MEYPKGLETEDGLNKRKLYLSAGPFLSNEYLRRKFAMVNDKAFWVWSGTSGVKENIWVAEDD
jgi:hypothetical protein